ncbi:MmgE/PrpD family protein [bacterium BMS3Bbin10]|nr:MmgE/PrpD family protein [bacterium BMS3Bbin10]
MRKVHSAGIAERLGAWVSGLSLSHVPEAALHVARRCIIDTSAVAIAGSRTGVAERLRAHVSGQYGSGACTLLGTAHSASALGAALANGTAAHALDFDDTSYAGVLHGSTIVLPAVLAAAQQADIAGGQFLEAFIAGSEAAYALGLTLTDTHYMRGWWATGTLGAIGAAAGAAKAGGLDADATARAIALAALGAHGMVAMLGTDAKPILAGQAARLGVESALLAAQGHSAPLQVFEDPRGLLALMNEGRADAAGLEELGQTWRLMEPGIAIKRHPVCSAAQAAMELTGTLIAENKLDREHIASVRCEVPRLVKISLVHDTPATPAQAQFSMPFAIGCILAYGALGPGQISAESLADARLRAAMERVEMAEAEDLNGEEYQPRYPECARVTLVTREGREVSGFLGAPAGMPENPLSDEALSEKFRDCCDFAGWPRERCETLLSALWSIERADSVSGILRGEG